MWKRRATLFARAFTCATSSPETTANTAATTSTTSLYSFLQPSIFAPKKPSPPQPPLPSQTKTPQKTTVTQKTHIESTLQNSLLLNDTESAWKSFKTLTSNSLFPSKTLTNSLIAHLSYDKNNSNTLNLKRAFASLIYVLEKNPEILDFETVRIVFNSMNSANAVAPPFALIKCLFKNRVFVPFEYWGCSIVEICKRNGKFGEFLKVFNECCRIAGDEKLGFMKPSLVACNAALEGCCFELESVSEAEGVVEKMSVLGIKPDELSFGLLGYLYASRGCKEKVIELKDLIGRFGFSKRKLFYSNLIRGYIKAGNLESVSETFLCSLKEENGGDMDFGEETYCEVVKGFIDCGSIKDLASLIIEAQKLEPETVVADKSVGFGVVSACVNLGLSDKAHSLIDEMNAQGRLIGIGAYMPILEAYRKENRTMEATQLVMDISNSGLHLDAGTYDTLIEASMTGQDFQSAFSLFREMREARVPDLKGSYLTIMTGLMENQRPELMAAFLDEVVEDPLVEVKTHDWNSIIHAFCKAGRLEDARRTLRRMIFLQFEPNDQTYLSLINGFVTAEKYFSVLMLWNDVKRKVSADKESGIKFDPSLVDAFLYALVKGGFFDAVMQVVEKSQEMKIFVDKWRYKQAFMETHKKLKVSKLRRRNVRKMEALIAFKNWAGLNT